MWLSVWKDELKDHRNDFEDAWATTPLSSWVAERLRSDEFLPLASRIRMRLPIERASPQDLQACLSHALR